MKYVVVERQPTGYWLDPEPYLAVLPEIAPQLPPGARAFAEAPAHYNFFHTECVKDLWLKAIDWQPRTSATLSFTANQWKHDHDLTLTYSGVVDLRFDGEEQVGTDARFGSLLLDELLPADDGFDHELVLTCGTLYISATDMSAEWVTNAPPTTPA